MGEAMLLAVEGQQQIAQVVGRALGRGISRVMEQIFRRMPNTSYPQDR
jgi:hypothetical protein